MLFRSKTFVLHPALAVSTGLATPAYAQLLRLAGFKPIMPPPLRPGHFGPPQPPRWRWVPQGRTKAEPTSPPAPVHTGNVFAELALQLR